MDFHVLNVFDSLSTHKAMNLDLAYSRLFKIHFTCYSLKCVISKPFHLIYFIVVSIQFCILNINLTQCHLLAETVTRY